MFHVFVALCLFGGTFFETEALKSCRRFRGVENFNLTRFLGTWYQVQQKGSSGSSNDYCPVRYFSLDKNGSMFDEEIDGLGGYSGPFERDALNSAKYYLADDDFDEMENITILATDYESYAVLYECNSPSEHSLQVLARNYKSFTSNLEKTINDFLKKKFRRKRLSKNDMSGCERVLQIEEARNLMLGNAIDKKCGRFDEGAQKYNATLFSRPWYTVQRTWDENNDSCPSQKNFILFGRNRIIEAQDVASFQLQSRKSRLNDNPLSEEEDSDQLEYVILSTDYETYSVICEPANGKIETISRKRVPSADFFKKVADALRGNEYGVKQLVLINYAEECEEYEQFK